jgi:hypothetical protein
MARKFALTTCGVAILESTGPCVELPPFCFTVISLKLSCAVAAGSHAQDTHARHLSSDSSGNQQAVPVSCSCSSVAGLRVTAPI